MGAAGVPLLTPAGLTKRARKGQGKVMGKSTREKTKRKRKWTKKKMDSTMLNPSRGRKEKAGPRASNDALDEGVASTARSSSRACMPNVRLTHQLTCAVQ